MKNIKIKIFAVILTLIVFASAKSNINKEPSAVSKRNIIQTISDTCTVQIKRTLRAFMNKE